MPRLFVALDPPDEVRDEIDRLCQGLPDARWTDWDHLHLTLRFIGEVDHDTFCEIGEALAGISMPPFDLQLRGIGQFPPRGALRHLWVGVAADPGLARLKRRVDRCVADAGVPAERRKFVPHVTLARFGMPPPERRLGSWIAARNLFATRSFPVSGFTLYSSILRSEGAMHVAEARYDFVTGAMERV